MSGLKLRFFSWLVMFMLVPALCFAAENNEKKYSFDFSLPVPALEKDRDYLGVPEGKTFRLEDVQAGIILIEIFSMYCPICQGEAAHVNTLFSLIQAQDHLKRNIRMIGIGAGNSAFEADFFRSNYQIKFPMLSDQDFEIHKKVGEVGTPHFFGLRIAEDKTLRLFFSHSGKMPDPEAFLEKFNHDSGLESGK